MGDWGRVAFCYDYETEDRLRGRVRCKGLVSKAYKYEDALWMIMHALSGAEYFLSRQGDKVNVFFGMDKDRLERSPWAELNMSFDVFFEHGVIRPGYDSVTKVITQWQQKQNGYKLPEDQEESLFNCEGTNGFLYMKYTGNLQDGYELKYGYYDGDALLDFKGALDKYKNRFSQVETEEEREQRIQETLGGLKEVISYFDENATLFSSEEEFWSMNKEGDDILWEVLEPKEEEEPEADPDSVDCLGLSVRTFSVIKRGGINTIEELKRVPDKELRAFRNMGSKSFAEIKEKLEQLEKQGKA